MPLPKEEIKRKLLHIVALTIPSMIFYLPKFTGSSQILPVGLLSVMFAFCLAIEIVRKRNAVVKRLFIDVFGAMLRREEAEHATGGLYIIASGALCALAFYRFPHVAFMSLSMFILGDALAAIVGMSMGRIRINGKTIEGSLACFVLSLLMCTLVFPRLPLLLDQWGGRIAIPVTLAASLSTTILELFPPGIPGKRAVNDNLTVPLLTGVLMIFTHKIAA